MQEFVLGMVLGAGLYPAYLECRLQLRNHRKRKLKKAQDQAIALLAECTCWDTNTGEHAWYCQLMEGAK
jgi:hypothetical protein